VFLCISDNFGSLNNTNFPYNQQKNVQIQFPLDFSGKSAENPLFSLSDYSDFFLCLLRKYHQYTNKKHTIRRWCVFSPLFMAAAAAVAAAGASCRTTDAPGAPFFCFVYVPGCKAHNGGYRRKCDQIDHRTLLS